MPTAQAQQNMRERDGGGLLPTGRTFLGSLRAMTMGDTAQCERNEEFPVLSMDTTEAVKAYASARISEARRLAEAGGVMVDGTVYDSSDASLIRLMAIVVFAIRDPNYTAAVTTRDGSASQLDSRAIYRVAMAIANHLQACAQWEMQQLQEVADATDEVTVAEIEERAVSNVPTSENQEPSHPAGSQSPPSYDDASLQHLRCRSAQVQEDVHVEGELVSDRLFSRDHVPLGSMHLDGKGAKNSNWVRAGAFLWRRGARQPATTTVDCTCTSNNGQAMILVFEPLRRATLGWDVAPNTSDALFTVPLYNTVQTDGSNEMFPIEIYIANVNKNGTVYLANYSVTLSPPAQPQS